MGGDLGIKGLWVDIESEGVLREGGVVGMFE